MMLTIYVNNQEAPQLRDYEMELRKAGHTVRYRAIKYGEPIRCDLVVTLPHHVKRVCEIFSGLPDTKLFVYEGKGQVDFKGYRRTMIYDYEPDVRPEPEVQEEKEEGASVPDVDAPKIPITRSTKSKKETKDG